jgi:hypothetical protein
MIMHHTVLHMIDKHIWYCYQDRRSYWSAEHIFRKWGNLQTQMLQNTENFGDAHWMDDTKCSNKPNTHVDF